MDLLYTQRIEFERMKLHTACFDAWYTLSVMISIAEQWAAIGQHELSSSGELISEVYETSSDDSIFEVHKQSMPARYTTLAEYVKQPTPKKHARLRRQVRQQIAALQATIVPDEDGVHGMIDAEASHAFSSRVI